VPPVLQVGDLVYLKDTATPGHLTQKWKGPLKVILTTPMAAKLTGFSSWVHVQNLKLAAPQKTYQFLLTGPDKIKISSLPRIPEDGDTHRASQDISRSPMPGYLASRLLTLYTSPLPFFPVSACPCFYFFIYTLYSKVLDFPPHNMINSPPLSYLFYHCFID
jgi:hypothetical protein